MRGLKLERPLAVFDIEATGLDRGNDRIVELSIVRLHPDGSRDEKSWRVNPGKPIPEEASAIHGIRDADVVNQPFLKQVAPQIVAFMDGCDLGGFNLIHFDVPMLTNELKRVGCPLPMEGRRILDAQKIYHQKEPRTLSAALQFYCGKEHTNAHGALADVEATIDVLEGQLERYEDLPSDLDGLHDFCNRKDPSWADGTGKLRWLGGELVINFGRNQGRKVRDLVQLDPGFINWIIKMDFPEDTKQILRNAKDGLYPDPPPR